MAPLDAGLRVSMSIAKTYLKAEDETPSAPLSRLHVAIIAVCALGFGFDLWEVALTSVLSAVFGAHADPATTRQLPWLLSSIYIGALVGAPVFGKAGDRLGRRTVLIGLMALLGLSSLAAAMTPSLVGVTVLRVIGGMAMGAYPPVMFAYLTDILPAARRGPVLILVSAIGALGAPLAIFLVRDLTPLAPLGLEGWRWAFVIGGGGAAVLALAFAALPESPRWLLACGRDGAADTIMSRFLASPPLVRFRTADQTRPPPDPPPSDTPSRLVWAVIFGLYFLSGWALISFPIISAPILLEKGFKLSDTLLYVGVAAFGPPIGSLAATPFIDKIDRRLGLGLCAGLIAVAIIAFAWGTSPLVLMASGFAFNLVALMYVPMLYILAGEVFPTRMRSFAVAISWAFNRLGAALAPLALLPLLKAQGPFAIAGIMIAALALSVLVIVTVAPRGARGQAVQ